MTTTYELEVYLQPGGFAHFYVSWIFRKRCQFSPLPLATRQFLFFAQAPVVSSLIINIHIDIKQSKGL